MESKIHQTKCFCGIVIGLLLSYTAMANVPGAMNYQAVVRNNAGAIMPNQHINLRFTIHRDSLTGGIKFQETDSVVTSPDGIFTVVIGGSSIASVVFDTIHWGACPYFLQVEMDITGGSSFVDMGTSQLVSVPYALYAKTAGAIDLAPSMYPTISGNDTIVVGSNGYLILTSTVTPSAAPVTLTAGVRPGQVLCIAGASTGSNGVRFTNGGMLNIGSGGPKDILAGSIMMLMWTGTQWVQISFSGNQ